MELSVMLAMSAAIIMIGFFGLMSRKNLLMIVISIEVMLNGAIMAMVVVSKHIGANDGHVMALLAIATAACTAGVGLAVVIALYRARGTIDFDAQNRLGD